jgi:hypothetical protein
MNAIFGGLPHSRWPVTPKWPGCARPACRSGRSPRRWGCPWAACRSRCGGQKFADALATGSPGDVVAVVDDELTCEDVQTPEDVQRLNTLEI